MRSVAVAITLCLLVGCREEGKGSGNAEYGGKDVGQWVKALSSQDEGERMKGAKAFVSLGPKGQGASDAIADALQSESEGRIAVKLAIALVQANTTLSQEYQDLAVQTFEGWVEKHTYSAESVQIAELERSPALGDRAGKLFEKLRAMVTNASAKEGLSSEERKYLRKLQSTLNP